MLGDSGMDIAYRIDNDFRFHPATGIDATKHETVRAILKGAAHSIVELVPAGREQSLMLTKLEEAMMWANAGIARSR